jgi:hypothetical protein
MFGKKKEQSHALPAFFWWGDKAFSTYVEYGGRGYGGKKKKRYTKIDFFLLFCFFFTAEFSQFFITNFLAKMLFPDLITRIFDNWKKKKVWDNFWLRTTVRNCSTPFLYSKLLKIVFLKYAGKNHVILETANSVRVEGGGG